MPTVLIKNGFRLFFYSNEFNEPVHIHVEKAENVAKFWIKPVKLAKNDGFNSNDLKKIIQIIFKNQKLIEEKWNEHFKK